jgi:hypothetical protein
MRKLLLFTSFAFFLSISFAASSIVEPPKKKLNAAEIFLPIGNTGKKISLLDFSNISKHDLELLTGRKMKFFETIAFKTGQKKLRNSINSDGTIEKRKIGKFFSKRAGETGFHTGGFVLGFLLGLIGILIAYLIKDDYKRNRVKWAWIGLAIWVGIWAILSASGVFL